MSPILLAPNAHARSSSSLWGSILDASTPLAQFEKMEVAFKRAPVVSSLWEKGVKEVKVENKV